MEFWLIMIAFIVMGGSCSLAGAWYADDRGAICPVFSKLRISVPYFSLNPVKNWFQYVIKNP